MMKRITAFGAVIGFFLAGVGMVALLVEGKITNLSKAHFAIAAVAIMLFAVTHFRGALDTFRSRTARFGALVSVYVIITVAIIISLNFMAALTSRQLVDLTENSLFTLAPQSKKVLDLLQEDLTIYAFFRNGRAGLESIRPIDRLVRTMMAGSPKVVLEIIDPAKDPLTAEQYGINQNATLVLEYKGRTQKINTITEQSLVNNIIRLLDDREKIICFTTRHGEPAFEGPESVNMQGHALLNEMLGKKDYTIQVTDLSKQKEVPPECTVMVVAGPRTQFSDSELVALDSFLQLGGRVLIAVDAGRNTRLELLLRRWGIDMQDNIIMEKVVEGILSGRDWSQKKSMTVKPSIALTASKYRPDYPITQDLSHIHETHFLSARALEPFATTTTELKTVDLVWSRKDSWVEKDVESVLKEGRSMLETNKGDRIGPAIIAMASSMTLQSPSEPLRGYTMQARLVAVGNAQWLTNRLFVESRNFNTDLMLNMLGWLAGMEQFIAIGVRSDSAKHLYLRVEQRRNIFYVAVVFLPELLLMIGALVWWVRR